MKIIAWPKEKNKHQNPYNYMLYKEIEDRETSVSEFSLKSALKKHDIFHIHWPDSFIHRHRLHTSVIKILLFIIVIEIKKYRGTKIVWTIHNIRAHKEKHPLLGRAFMKYISRRIDGYISLSETAKIKALKEYPKLASKKDSVIYHPTYEGYYNKTCNAITKNKNIRSALFVGQIRKYKNLEKLIIEFGKLSDKEYQLIIAGKPESNSYEKKIEKMCQERNISYKLKFLSDSELCSLVQGTELLIFPYKEILNSGSIMLGLTFEKKILAPNKGSIKEIAQFFPSYITTYDNKITASDIAKAFKEKAYSTQKSLLFTPKSSGKKTYLFYKNL